MGVQGVVDSFWLVDGWWGDEDDVRRYGEGAQQMGYNRSNIGYIFFQGYMLLGST